MMTWMFTGFIRWESPPSDRTYESRISRITTSGICLRGLVWGMGMPGTFGELLPTAGPPG